MKRHLILLSVLVLMILSTGKIFSQENNIFRFYYLHQDIQNPAITGSEYIPKACISYSKQWVGIPESPHTLLASASIRIGNYDFYNPKKIVNTTKFRSQERVGLGLSVFSDRNGPVASRGISLSYAYHLPLENGCFSFGISGNGAQKILDESVFRPTYPGDPVLSGTRESFMFYNASFGAYYYSAGVFGGAAVHHLIPLEDKSRPGNKVKPDVMLHCGYLFSSFGKPMLEISANLRYLDLYRLEYDFHFRTYLREVHWLDISYRSYNAVALHLGIKISSFYLAYSYEANLSSMIRYQAGSHAIHLGINLGMRRISW
jgi:type IX secretion system PorP/SprF family membrane protein